MTDKRTHRGPHPDDAKLFTAETIPHLRAAVADYSGLLSKGYAAAGSLKLVGDHFNLTARQRLALMRSACSDKQLEDRRSRKIAAADLNEKTVSIDGFNLIITLEAALSGAYLFIGRDGCIRDLAGLHGTYRIVSETQTAVQMMADTLGSFKVKSAEILLDRPVSNSGRLKKLIESFADERRLPWVVRLENSPDRILCQSPLPVITADSAVLDCCGRWVNLMAEILPQIPFAKVIDLSENA